MQTAAELTVPTTPPEFFDVSKCWRNDKKNMTISFGNFDLKRTHRSAGRNPYLVVQVDSTLIENDDFSDHHNDVWDRDLTDFVKQLILISSQTAAQTGAIEVHKIEDRTSRSCQVDMAS
jgi:hypothetical protein